MRQMSLLETYDFWPSLVVLEAYAYAWARESPAFFCMSCTMHHQVRSTLNDDADGLA